MEIIDVVNEKDEVVGKASYQEIYQKLLTHRVVHIFIFNNKNEILLQMRSNHVKFCPNYWNTSAAGHVQSGEKPEEAALRETEEELGIATKINILSKDLYMDTFKNTGIKKILYVYKSIYNGPFKINLKEVEKVDFFSLEKIQNMIESDEKFHPELLFLLRKHFGII